ncbi:periplasmic heavy metal sensor [Pseudooceanicola nanhaiensis]|uniref:periplasmic heavy metal sensor n=1 Tax=Pseudooceanicola nanhaiensis TaxID=375761 RepID=UPI0040582F15
MSETKTHHAPMRRWQKVLLALSLAVNLLIVVAVASFVLTHDGDRRHRPPRVDQMGGPLTGALSREDRREIGRALWRSYRDGRPSRADMRAELADVIAALRREPYDPAVVEQSLQKQLEFAVERQELGQRLLRERLAAMTPAERAAFADRLEEGLERMREHERRRAEDKD